MVLGSSPVAVKSYYGKTKWIYLLIENDDLLEIYNTIWDKVSSDIKKNMIASMSIIKKKLKSKVKCFGDKVTDFYAKKNHQVNSNYTCLAIISLDSALKKDETYCPQVFLKACKYIEKRVVRYINNNLSDFSYSDESDEE